MIKKSIFILVTSLIISLSASLSVFAGQWKSDTGGWWYQRDDGSYPSSTWLKDSNLWYYFHSNGYMATGWVQDSGNWYYMHNNGAMATGWIEAAGKWYYLNSDGTMLSNTSVGGYQLGADGAWIQTENAETHAALPAYAELLRTAKSEFDQAKSAGKYYKNAFIKFGITYIDADNIPELVLEYHTQLGKITTKTYTYYGGNPSLLISADEKYTSFNFYEKQGLIYLNSSGEKYTESFYAFAEVTNGTYNILLPLSNIFNGHEITNWRIDYEKRGNYTEVSEAAYKKAIRDLLQPYNILGEADYYGVIGNPKSIYDLDYVDINDGNIQRLLNGEMH